MSSKCSAGTIECRDRVSETKRALVWSEEATIGEGQKWAYTVEV